MPRSKVVIVNGKSVTVKEQRVGELEALATKLGMSLDALLAVNTAAALGGVMKNFLVEKIPELFPDLTQDDVVNAYPSELEALVEAFIDVNFFGLKRLAGPFYGLVRAGLGQR